LLLQQPAQAWDVPFIDLKISDVNSEALRVVPEKYAPAHTLIPFGLKERRLHVAMCHPRDRRVIADIEQLAGHQVIPYLAADSTMRRAHLLYKGDLRDMLERSVANKTSTLTTQRRPSVEDPTAVDLVTRILEYAAVSRA